MTTPDRHPPSSYCPECHHPTTWQDNPWRPFCSERCQLLDLGAWAGGQYRIKGSSLTVGGTERSDQGDE
ncbi:MAG: DNA gyrase inhibitor YacG [Nitrospira sp.]|nr:DNA gyrase inhibitor YacG [Nitrospira sp. NTP2]MCK6493113.1 DNA gyrase inhibitor YacG [Nitrospira sp.]MEB2340176.1 DNA gyrase inhibitor YacG [Nitrospirales bacterium]QOJ33725.1 MAG: DNA gyrase inhibitor YacG [Nitrospira sp.]RIK55995.1 MAG: DNA gyrase inhibitor YacG [Nitrospira sp.]